MLAMARDGLAPPSFFGAVHSKFRTLYKTTILTGFFVASMAAFIPLRILAERPFRAPLVPLVPILGILTCMLLMFSLPAENWLRLVN